MTYLLLEYGAKVTAVSGLFFAVYWLVLRNNGLFAANRMYLLLSTISALLLPVLQLPFLGADLAISGKDATLQPLELNFTNAETEAGITSVGTTVVQENWQYLEYGVIAISALLVLRVIWSLACTLNQIIRGLPGKQAMARLTVIKVEGTAQAFSFFRWIFIPDQAFGNEKLLRTRLAHETCHDRQWHSMDRILLEFATAICWWNPFFHLIKHQLVLTHEYLADEASVMEVGQQAYAQILVS
jgi:hypothetical protein